MLSQRSIPTVLLVCLLVTFAGAATASAAPPAANNDTISAAPNGVRDVLFNDSDADGSPSAMRVVGNSQPSHGSVDCSALGSCLYKGEAGYAGSDSFTYTVRDAGGEESTGTVAVTVAANNAAKALIARDDDAATLAGGAVVVDVMANDSGGTAPVKVLNGGPASHGTVSCDDTRCAYTPDPGYSGSDGFPYTVEDSTVEGGPRQAKADVHVLVAPEGAGYGLKVGGMPESGSAGGAVPSGGLAHWFAGVTVGPDGITGEELGALPLPSVTTKLDGPHSAAGDVKTATGWKAGTSGGSTTLEATKDALLGEGVTEAFPKPLPPISQGTGGDGHVPILVGSKVFAFYHHSSNTSATCVDRVTGTTCPGYPKKLDWSTDDINGPGAVVGSQIWTRLIPQYGGGGAGSVPYGMYCWDTEADTTCGFAVVDRADGTNPPDGSPPVAVGGKLWFGTEQGKLFCVDPGSQQVCGEYSTGQVSGAIYPSCCSGAGMDIATHGDRVFVSRSNDKVACFDTVARAACSGWSEPKSFGGAYNLVNQYDSNGSGNAIGVCVIQNNSTIGTCVPDGDPSSTVALSGWPGKGPYHTYYSSSLEGETGTRTMVGSLSVPGMGCFDWTTMKPCTGGGYDSAGWLDLPYDPAKPETYGQEAYGVAFDGSCAIGVGDPGKVYTVDPAGTAPCNSLRSGAKQKAVDLRDQRCDGGVGAASWRDVTLTDTNSEEMESITVTVRDARTKEVLASGNLVGGDGKLDLSGVDPTQHPAITVDANAKSRSGNHAWDDSIPPRITVRWKSDPQQACFDTRGAAECGPSSPLGIGVLGHLDAPARDEKATLDLIRNGCPAAPAQPQAQPQPEPGKPVAATAVPRKCSGLRLFKIHVNYASKKVRTVTVTVNGKKQKLVSMKGKPTFQVDLRGMGKQKATVKIELRTRSGKKVAGARVYNPCTPKLPDRGFTL